MPLVRSGGGQGGGEASAFAESLPSGLLETSAGLQGGNLGGGGSNDSDVVS